MPRQRREWKIYNDDVERTFTQHQTQITQLDSSISLQASTITSLDGKVENYYSELTIADTGIRTEVATKVGADTIISTINQSPESVTINASKISLAADVVTFTKLSAYDSKTISSSDTDGQTLTINGSTMTGTDDDGYTGYIIRPYGFDIYSFTSANTRIAVLRSLDITFKKWAWSGSSIAQTTVTESCGSIYAVNGMGTGFGRFMPNYDSGSLKTTAMDYCIDSGRKHNWWGGAYYMTLATSSGYAYSGTRIFSADTEETRLYNPNNLKLIGDSWAYLQSGNAYVQMYNNELIMRGNEYKLTDVDETHGLQVYHGSSTADPTGVRLFNGANSSLSDPPWITVGYDGNIHLHGSGIYFNGTKIR